MAHENVIIVAVDGSPAARAALRWGFEQAKRREAELRLICVYQLPYFTSRNNNPGETGSAPSLGLEITPIVPEAVREEGKLLYEAAEANMQRLVAEVSGQGVEVTSQLIDGDPSEVLVEMSKEVALIVLGGHGLKSGRIADRILRTVSTAVPAYAYCPTVVVPPESVQRCLPIKKIVVGVDGSEAAKIALQRGVWEADRWDAHLNIFDTVNVDPVSWVPQFALTNDIFDDVREVIERQLREVDEGRDIDSSITVGQGNPVGRLAEFSREADLVIVGTRGRGGFRGLLLGSTSQSLLGYAECPVMVVPRRIKEGDDVGPNPRRLREEK